MHVSDVVSGRVRTNQALLELVADEGRKVVGVARVEVALHFEGENLSVLREADLVVRDGGGATAHRGEVRLDVHLRLHAATALPSRDGDGGSVEDLARDLAAESATRAAALDRNLVRREAHRAGNLHARVVGRLCRAHTRAYGQVR